MNLFRRVLLLVAVSAFTICAYLTLTTLIGYRQASVEIEESRQYVSIPESFEITDGNVQDTSVDNSETIDGGGEVRDPIFEALANVDLTAIQEINPDIIAWILIPDSEISYPVLQCEDNTYYLNRTWKRTENTSGSVFADYRCSPSFDDFNTVLYGHRMANGGMFAPLAMYADEDYYLSHPYIYLITQDGIKKYEVFSAYKANISGVSWKLDFGGDDEKTAYIDYCVEHSVNPSAILPETDSNILTLSTCTENVRDYVYRWVVHALLVSEA